MRRTLVIPLLSATLLAGALIGSGAALSEDSAPPATTAAPDPAILVAQRAAGLSFAQPKYVWSYTDVKAGKVSAEIVNERVNPATIKPVLTLRGPVVASDLGKAADSALRVAVDREVPAGGRGIISVSASDGRPALSAGTYTGRLAAYATDGRAVIHVPVTLTVAAAGTAGTVAPKPLAAKVRIQAIRWVPFLDRTVALQRGVVPLSASVPATTPAANIALDKGAVLGGLPGDRSGIVSVTYAGAVEQLREDGVLALKLDARNFDGPGTYEGTIHLLGEDDDSGDVTVTVVAKDSIIWALIALAGGVMLAMWVRRWRGVERPLTLLQRRLESARGDYTKATLENPATDHGPRYDTSEDFNKLTTALGDELNELKGAHGITGFLRTSFGLVATPFDKLPAERRQAIVRKLVKLEAHVADLQALVGVSDALRTQLGKVRNLGVIPALLPAGVDATPAWVANAQSKLVGSTMTVDTFAKRLADMRVATDVGKWWTQAHAVVKRDAQWIKEAHAAKVDTKTAHSVLGAAWTKLWLAEDAEAVADKRRRANLERGDWLVLLLLSELEDDVRRAAMTFASEGDSVTLGAGDGIPQMDIPLATAEIADRSRIRSEELARRLRTGDAVATLLAWVLAIFTGLTALYFTKTFGSPTDYATAILWGLTTAAAVDALIVALPQGPEPDVSPKGADAG